ncbi:terminase small subunit [Mycobacterium phage Saguaro]|uniref:Adenylate kinase n=1 Tax=Mycobacterium phage Saguaro TaxID=2315616 RepID=A0A386KB41_9CAUD|nr:terminase small subunit [Mycobacterium phage Saguaro]AYD82002.1 adenylate kinase [Mycobacterium phage Saguaro]
MTHCLIYLVGPPGSGKSTLMARLTGPLERIPFYDPRAVVAHDQLFADDELVGAEIGIRRELFSGTDALPASIIEKAVPWVQTMPYRLLLAEGQRLANRRFLTAAADAGYEVVLALLDHEDTEDWRRKRARAIGRTQNAAWVKGRISASRNLAEQMRDRQNVTVLTGHPDELYPVLEQLVG